MFTAVCPRCSQTWERNSMDLLVSAYILHFGECPGEERLSPSLCNYTSPWESCGVCTPSSPDDYYQSPQLDIGVFAPPVVMADIPSDGAIPCPLYRNTNRVLYEHNNPVQLLGHVETVPLDIPNWIDCLYPPSDSPYQN